MSERLARLIGLRDYFSMDFRIDEEGKPTFFEFEVCPGVTIYDFQNYLATAHGLGLGEALARAFVLAFERSRAIGEA
jgi:D-alanine-D-alanine ligase